MRNSSITLIKLALIFFLGLFAFSTLAAAEPTLTLTRMTDSAGSYYRAVYQGTTTDFQGFNGGNKVLDQGTFQGLYDTGPIEQVASSAGSGATYIDENKIQVVGQNNIDQFARMTSGAAYGNDSAAGAAEMRNRLSGAQRGGPSATTFPNGRTDNPNSTLENYNSNPLNASGKKEPPVYSPILNILLFILYWLCYLTTLLLSFLLDIASKMLDFAFSATHLASSKIVQDGWTFTRDTLNFIFILVLLAISFSTIAGLETFNRKLIPRLLFAALLVNFSLSISAAFLQVSNVMTTSIAKSVMPANSDACPATDKDPAIGCRLAIGLTNAGSIGELYTYKNVDWLSKLFGTDAKVLAPAEGGITWDNAKSKSWDEFLAIVVKSAMAMILIGIFTAAFIFLGVLIFVRLIALVILLILAPIPYVFSVVPRAQKYADEWWTKFINYTFFLPITTFFLALAIRLLQDTGGATSTDKSPLIAAFWGTDGRSANWFVNVGGSIIDVIFVTIFIFAATYVARSLSIFGASGALSAAKGAVFGAGRLGTMPARLVGRGMKEGAGAVARRSGVPGLYSGIKEGWAGKKADQANRVRTGAAAQLGARISGGKPARDAIFAKQMADKQKEMKSEDVATLEKKAASKGAEGAAATMELLERDKLGKGKINNEVLRKFPEGSAAQEKLKKEWIRKDPLEAIKNTTKENDRPAAMATAIRKMKPDDLAQVDSEDFKKILEMTEGQGLIFNQSHVRAVAASSNDKLAEVISGQVEKMEKEPGFNPGKNLVIAEARRTGLRKSSGGGGRPRETDVSDW